MRCTPRNIFAALSLLLLATVFSPAAFINNDTSGMTVLVDFDQFDDVGDPHPYGSVLTGGQVEVYSQDGLTIHMAVADYNGVQDPVRYGLMALLVGGVAGDPTDPYLKTPDDAGSPSPGPEHRRGIEFTITGDAVSAIGIHLSVLDYATATLTPIVLEVFSGSTLLESRTINGPSDPEVGDLQAENNDPSLGRFVGFSSTSNNITGFRITGGQLVLDDLRFRFLEDGGDPAPVPEASTMLLCGSALVVLAIARRYKILSFLSNRQATNV